MGTCFSPNAAGSVPAPDKLQYASVLSHNQDDADNFKLSKKNLVSRYIKNNYNRESVYNDITEIIFQYYFIKKLNLDSLILTNQNDVDTLDNLLAPRFISILNWHEFKLRLLFRRSIDGNHPKIFHLFCDGNTNTLTLVRTKKGQIFGAFTTKDWGADNGYYRDDSAFLFRLHQPKVFENKEKNGQAVYVHSSYGPTFGFEHDLFLHSGNDNMSFCDLGKTYDGIGRELCGVPKGKRAAGRYYFEILEYEVFALE